MRFRIPLLASLCAITLLAPAARSAPVLGAEVFGSLNTYAMSDVNDIIDFVNTSAGSDFDDISTSFGGGLGARVWLTPNVMVNAVWEPLFAKTESEAAGATGDYDVGGNSYQLGVGYMFPTSPKAKLGFGAGVGMYVIGGEVSDPSGSLDVEGSAVGFHLNGLGEWTVSPGFAVHGAIGYRIAKIDNTEYGGIETQAETDYSGLLARVGLAFYLPGNQ